jgi:hypothetical protein
LEAIKKGSPFMYVSHPAFGETAPGQFLLMRLKRCNMRKFAVIGNPIINSASPIIYNHLFKINNLDAYYSRLLVTDIKNGLETFHLLKLDAVNVTMPYKQLVYGWVDYPDEISKITRNLQYSYFQERFLAIILIISHLRCTSQNQYRFAF